MTRVLRWLCVAFVAFFVAGCATPRDRAVMAMNGVATFADGAHDHIADQYRSALKQCVDLADTKPKALMCGNDVDAKFDPLWKAYRGVRSTWLILATAVQAAELSGDGLSELEALELLAQLSAAVTEFKSTVSKGNP